MADTFEVSAPELNRTVYVAIAATREDPRLDVITGVTYYLLLQQPDLAAAGIGEQIAALSSAVDASTPNPQFDRAMDDSLYMCRILARLAPRLKGSALEAGMRDYARAFLNSYRRGLDLFRQVAPLDTQIDRFSEVARFRRDTWENLYALAAQRPDAAQAIDASRIAQGLGVTTTQDASALLAAVPIPALADFVSGHRQPDGGLHAALPDLQTGIAAVSTSASGMSSAYFANLFDLDCWEQAFRDVLSIFWPKDDKDEKKTDLEKAIEKTEKAQKDLDEALSDVRAGVKGTLDVFAFLIRGDKDLAADVKKLTDITVALLDDARKYSKEAISAAKKLTGLLGLDITDFAALSAIGFTVGLIAIGIEIFDILGKKDKPSVEEQILQQLKQISTQIKDLRKEMNVRFDRIEKQLNAMLDSMLEQFARIDFDLGKIEGNVEEIQFGLYNLHSELQRMNRNIHTFLEAAHRRELVEAINGFLNFRERTGQDLDFASFLTGENEFYSWGFSHAQDPLQAGPPQRSFQDGDLFNELDSFPLATNVNFLREFPAARFSLPPLALNRLANPSDWITASEGYAQLSEESPNHAANISAERVQDLVEVGERLGESLSKIADNTLFNALSAHYLAQFASLKAAIGAFETEFRNDPNLGLAGIDLFGGANQVPKTHFLDRPRELARCDNKSFGGSVNTLTTDLAAFDHHELAPYMIAGNLGLGRLDACIFATWTKKSVTPIFGERFNVVFQLVVKIRIRFSGATVFEHTFDPNKTFSKVLLKKELDTFNPNAFNEPHEPLPGLWSKLGTFPATHSLVNPGLLAATVTAVEAALVLAQRAFYAQVSQRLVQAGDPIQEAGDRLDGSKLLWQSFVALGLPLSVERNDFLRGLLFGSEGLLAGTDAGSQDALLDDIQDIYTFISTREEAPPAANIIVDIETLLQGRVQTLVATLAAIVAAIEASSEPEPPQLFAPTLLRLSLIESRTP